MFSVILNFSPSLLPFLGVCGHSSSLSLERRKSGFWNLKSSPVFRSTTCICTFSCREVEVLAGIIWLRPWGKETPSQESYRLIPGQCTSVFLYRPHLSYLLSQQQWYPSVVNVSVLFCQSQNNNFKGSHDRKSWWYTVEKLERMWGTTFVFCF